MNDDLAGPERHEEHMTAPASLSDFSGKVYRYFAMDLVTLCYG